MNVNNKAKGKLRYIVSMLLVLGLLSSTFTRLVFANEKAGSETKITVSAKTPKLLNMTFNGDPKTSIGFAWYTEPEVTRTVVQVVEASKALSGAFPEKDIINFTGSTEVIETFVKEEDRDGKKYTKFASHRVIADQLKPGTKYIYRVGNGDVDGWGEIGSFSTDTATDQDFHFVVGSDSQGSVKKPFDLWQDTFRKAINHIGDPKFFILSGDLVDNGDLEEQWQMMLGIPHKEFANVPFVPVLGGHEVCDYDGDETTDNDNFYNHFNLPKNVGVDAHPGSIYSFEYGNALFIQMNSQYMGETDESGKIEWADEEFYTQLEWMKNQVAKTDKKWKFVSFHKGPYSVADNATLWEGEKWQQFYREHLIPAFDEMGIDIAFVAHDHMYMRSYQMLNDTPLEDYSKDAVTDPKGTVYLMTNSVGNKFYDRTIEDEDGNPIPEDKLPIDYFSWIDVQPWKKMFVDVSVTEDNLTLTSYTAALGEPVTMYDTYSITRNDAKPNQVENAKIKLEDQRATISWEAPSNTIEPIRGFRIYEKDDKVKTNWSVYIPVQDGQTEYNHIVQGIKARRNHDFIIKAVGARNNSDPVIVKIRQ